MATEHDNYLDYLNEILRSVRGAKVKTDNRVDAVRKILNYALSKVGKFAFMFPSLDNANNVVITIRDINNGVSTCVTVSTQIEGKYIRALDARLSFGKCEKPKVFKPAGSFTSKYEIDDILPLGLIQKISSNLYANYPIA